MSDRILIDGIEFYGFHGVAEAERAVGHRFRADVTLELDLHGAGASDNLTQTVDYGAAVTEVLAVGTGEPVRLLETLAERTAARLLASFPLLRAVEVRITKLLPPVPAVVAACSVEIRRERVRGDA
jgi:dihydroneopterin aldolase